MSPASGDYYVVLGVRRDASEEEIRRAFRRLAREHHPDVNRGTRTSEERFKAINEAYDVLGDRQRRRDYDEFGSNWRHADELRSGGRRVFRGRRSRGRGQSSGSGGFSFADMFGFGNSANAGGGLHSNAVETTITLEDALSGTEVTVSVSAPNGATRSLAVKIPPGIANGGKVRVQPSGMGPLDVSVRIADHSRFERVGDDLKMRFEAPLHVPLLGGIARVTTLDGAVELTIPSGTQNGKVFRLAGKGMPRLRASGRGDLLAELKVVLPQDLSEEELRLAEMLRARGG